MRRVVLRSLAGLALLAAGIGIVLELRDPARSWWSLAAGIALAALALFVLADYGRRK